MGLLILEKKFFKGFYHTISTWRPSWSCDQDHVNKLLFWPPKLSPYESYEFNWPSGFREDVWKCWQTDAGVTGILLAHPWAFGSGELKKLFHEHYQSVKLYGSISGLTFRWPDLGPNCLQRLSQDHKFATSTNKSYSRDQMLWHLL